MKPTVLSLQNRFRSSLIKLLKCWSSLCSKIFRLARTRVVVCLSSRESVYRLLWNLWQTLQSCFWMRYVTLRCVCIVFSSFRAHTCFSHHVLACFQPTSGLDARAASIVMKGLKRIALSGRAVCATIHQPSIAIFNAFDALLLLKRGGETVFFGPLGKDSCNLIQYFERFEATPKISVGENPSSWMLSCIGAGSNISNKKPFDYAGSFKQSKLHRQCLEAIDLICSTASDSNRVSFNTEYAASVATQSGAVLRKAVKVYYRSPTYNVTRIMVSAIGNYFVSFHVTVLSVLLG